MRTFAHKPKATQQTKPAKSAKADAAHSGQNRDVQSILHLQRTIGNQAVQRLLRSNTEDIKANPLNNAPTVFVHDFSRIPVHASVRSNIQPKLKVNVLGDQYEQEADRVADQVIQMPRPERQHGHAYGGGKCRKSETKYPEEKQLSSQAKYANENASEHTTSTTPLVPKILHSPGQPLDQSARSYFEPRFGHDFGQVRVHSSKQANQVARSINARAFTVCNHIVFGSAQHLPNSREGQHLPAHELTHAIQQSGGSVNHGIGSLRHHGLIQRTPAEAEALISQYTSWGNLNETMLGREVLRLALRGQLTLAGEVLNALGSTDRDDVAYEFMFVATDSQLVSLAAATASRRFLHRLFDELTSGSVAAEEQQQANRILQVTASQTVSVAEFDAAATSRRTKIFPFRLPGFTVLNDAPIEARRERGGVWVRTVTRVLGTDMFRAETATLPTEYFIGGIVLPETEIIGVRLYDQGGIIHYTTPLFLIQLANATNQRIFEKILEAAGIGLTLGTGALAGLGVEASMAARVLLWADRAAFALGTVTSVLREHRSWLVEHFGSGFMDAVDTIHSAAAIYGLARVVFQAPRIIQGLRDSYRTFREAARSQSSGFSSGERATIQQVSQSTDDLISQIDNIEGARPVTRPGATEPATPPASTTRGPAEPAPSEALEVHLPRQTQLGSLIEQARDMVRRIRQAGGEVVANMGGAGASHEPPGAININNQAVGRHGIPNHINADASDIGQLFEAGSIDRVVGHHMPPSVIDWQRAVRGIRSVLRSGGTFRFDWRGATPEAAQVERLLQEAGFLNIQNFSDAVVTAIRP